MNFLRNTLWSHSLCDTTLTTTKDEGLKEQKMLSTIEQTSKNIVENGIQDKEVKSKQKEDDASQHSIAISSKQSVSSTVSDSERSSSSSTYSEPNSVSMTDMPKHRSFASMCCCCFKPFFASLRANKSQQK